MGAPPLCLFLGRRSVGCVYEGSYMGGSLQSTISSSLR